MASNASSSSSTQPTMTSIRQSMETERRIQAEPLPPKIGELGFPGAQGSSTSLTPSGGANLVDVPLGPHPAENRSTSTPTSDNASTTTLNEPSRSSNSTHSAKRSILKFLRVERPIPTLKGIRVSTVVRLAVTLLTLTGTIIGWAMIITHLNRSNSSPSPQPSDPSTPESDDGNQMGLSGFVFVHVAFGVATVVQLFLLERTVFLARAERYNYLHPGGSPGSAGTTPYHTTGLRALAPWNRPPLPTYAAALGFRGTGDVEDNVIAAPPPPAYGNTRGSTLLLTGMLRNSLVERNRQDALENGSRPVSYVSRSSRVGVEVSRTPSRGLSDGGAEYEVSDMERAMRVEATLARLEEGSSRLLTQPPPAVLRS